MYLAQSQHSPVSLMFSLVLILISIFWAYFAISLSTIARKTGTPNGWMAWFPILNIFLTIAIADRPAWWFLLLLLGPIGVVVSVIIWMDISEKRGQGKALGAIVAFFPILIGILAFTD